MPKTIEPPLRRIDRLSRRVGRQSGIRLHRELVRAPTLEPRLTAAKAASAALAACVHLLVLTSAALGIFLLTRLSPVGVLAGAALIGFAVQARPRLGKLPKERTEVSRADAPELWAATDEVANAVGTRPPHVLLVDEEFGAWVTRVGTRRRGVLCIGLPLWSILEPPERVALLAHELAHLRHGDITRGLLVGSSIDALVELHEALRPYNEDPDHVLGLAHIATDVVMSILALPVRGLLYLQWALVQRDSQRAEYLADAVAARVAGSPAEIGLDEKVLLAGTAEDVIRRHSLGKPADALFAELRAAALDVPERERERRRRIARLEDARLSDTHPPTALRIALIESRPPEPGVVHLAARRSARIDDELSRYEDAIARDAVDRYRSELLVYG